MDKAYIEREYVQLVREFNTAASETEQWECRTRMANLERTAMELFGFDYVDELHSRCLEKGEG